MTKKRAIVAALGCLILLETAAADDFAWSYLVHFGLNLWRDTPIERAKGPVPDKDSYTYCADHVRFDHAEWIRLSQRLKDAGCNQIVIDLAEFPVYPSHPELAVKGSWPVTKIRKELARLREMGFEVVPKLNFSATHAVWLKDMRFKISTPEYRTLCADLIRDVIEMFDRPRLFHLGWDEEDVNNGQWPEYQTMRRGERLWDDFRFLVREVEKDGARPWIWADLSWHPSRRQAFLDNCPRSVLLGSWYYWNKFDASDPTMPESLRNALAAYVELDKAGYEQVPCASVWDCDENAKLLAEFAKGHLTPSRVKGFMMAPWLATADRPYERGRADAAVARLADVIRSWDAGRNFIVNPDFAGDGLGGALNWRLYRPAEGSIVRTPGAGYGGSTAVELKFGTARNYVAQSGFRFEPGERHRFSFWVRTHGLEQDHGFGLAYYNYAWAKEKTVGRFPCDTHGEWVKVSADEALLESKDKSYGIVFWGQTKNPAAKVEISAPSIEPLTDAGRAVAASQAPAKASAVRIVPIDPLLAKVDAAEGRMTFYYPGDISTVASETLLEATVDGKDVVSAPFGDDHRAMLKLGARTVGRHELAVRVKDRKTGKVVAENAYAIRVVQPDPKGPAGKKLNNFVTELLRTKAANGEVRFFNPREGWVYIGFGRELATAGVSLDDQAFPVVRHRPGENSETMRYLPCGWHVLHVEGVRDEDAVLFVRTVKRIVHLPADFDRRPSDWSNWKYRYDFCKRYLFPFHNTASAYSVETAGWPNEAREAYLRERGMDSQVLLCFPKKEDQANPDAWVAKWRESPAFRAGMSIQMDEMAMSYPRPVRLALAEACWRYADVPQRIDAFVCDPFQSVFNDPTSQASLVSSVVNSGLGQGMVQPEVYSPAIADESKAYDWEDYMLRYVRSMEAIVPASRERMLWYFATFLSPGSWNDWPSPEADIRVLYAHFIHRLATDPAFADTIGGIAMAFMSDHVDEDVTRWLAKIMRYYCVEGGTDYLPERYGFKYLPGILRDGDFTKGFAEWKPEPAEKGSLTAATRKGLGTVEQHRMKVPEGTGDTHARFVRSAHRPNRLSQRLTGLEPGQLYNLMFLTEDEDDLDHPGSVRPDFSCRVTFDGADEVPELEIAKDVPASRGPDGKLWNGKAVSLKTLHRVVFRARRRDVTLTFDDWKSEAEPGAPIGRKTLLNYVHVRKYYLESEAEFDWLVNQTRELNTTWRNRK